MLDMADMFNMANVNTNHSTIFCLNFVASPEYSSILKLFKLSTLLALYSYGSYEC